MVHGKIQVDFNNPQNSKIGTISVDINKFRSDSSRRDSALRDCFLQSAKYPFATFEPITTTSLPNSYTAGEELNFQANGNLTVWETFLPVTLKVTVKATKI